ncbi:MAG TPA: alpha/beta fold hydrolase, partial [Bryobacteraceae bacterium]|nr:alpha/beta fold hydrolase [Bryobacteraceae bacterium]
SFVEENNLSQNISALRKVLEGPFIETVPKRGYRFAADVSVHTGERTTGQVVLARAATAQAVRVELPKPADIRYARSGDVNIAYQVLGEGPVDLVFVMGWVSHLEWFWAEPSFARFLRRLASFSRLILFDKRGTGLSDRVPLRALPTLEQRMDDVRAVLQAVGSRRAAILGVSEGGPMSALFAATYPERTLALMMIGTYARRLRDADYPWGPTAEERDAYLREIESTWGGPVGLEERAPSQAGNQQFRDWWASYLRMGASPGAALALTKMNAQIDVRQVLPTVRVPTLVLHRRGDRCLKVDEGRYVASLIRGARFVELPGEDHLPFVGDQDTILDEIQAFLAATVRHNVEADRVLATVLCLGQEPSEPESRERMELVITREVDWYGGSRFAQPRSATIASFDGPARAIRCAAAIVRTASEFGLLLSAGLHTGECEKGRDGLISGPAVEIASRVAKCAGRGEVLVSRTVRDLTAGSGIHFEEKDLLTLARDLGEWRLFKAEPAY